MAFAGGIADLPDRIDTWRRWCATFTATIGCVGDRFGDLRQSVSADDLAILFSCRLTLGKAAGPNGVRAHSVTRRPAPIERDRVVQVDIAKSGCENALEFYCTSTAEYLFNAMTEATQRKWIAKLARGFVEGVVDYEKFATAVFEADQDDEIDELGSLITHMPKRRGFGGLSEDEYERYLEDVLALIRRLEA